MTTTDMISAVALLMMLVIAVLLLAHYLKLQRVWDTIANCRTTLRWDVFMSRRTRSFVRRYGLRGRT